jgi:epoxyqueuosine reductase
MTVYEKLAAELSALRCRFGILNIDRVAELKRELETRLNKGQIDQDFYRNSLERLELGPSLTFPEARSLILIAVPLTLTRLSFDYQGRHRPVQIPPFYVFKDKMAAIRKAMGRSLGAAGNRIADARVPYKLAAVRSGLARYGRNNLAYVDGMGSFFRLVAFYSDLTAPADAWFRLSEMPECSGCGFCLGNCHTNCLDPDVDNRFMARAERCLTLYNEEPGEMPDWVGPWHHNSLIGCMRCQSGCPLNRSYIRDIPVSDTFNEAESEAILATPVFADLPQTLKSKLSRYDLEQYYELVPRNLKYLLEWEL